MVNQITDVFKSVLEYLGAESVIAVDELMTVFFEVFSELTADDIMRLELMVCEGYNTKDSRPVTGFSLSGYAGTGKSTIADALKKHGYTQLSFGSMLKDIAAYLFNLDRKLLEGDTKESRLWRELPCDTWPTLTPRAVLQKLGTNVFRRLYSNIWLMCLSSRLSGKVVITDARFINELQLSSNHGLTTVVVIRPGIGPQSSHPSETEHTSYTFDVVINNDCDMCSLETKVLHLLSQKQEYEHEHIN